MGAIHIGFVEYDPKLNISNLICVCTPVWEVQVQNGAITDNLASGLPRLVRHSTQTGSALLSLGQHVKIHQQNSTFHVQSFGRSHKQSSFYTQTRYVKGLFLVQRRSGENFR